jgi:phosphatidylserine decarboxylase
MSIGHSPTQPQHTPDMRKDASDVTEEDKKEAKRRIQGSGFAEDNTPDDSGGDVA